VSAIAARERAIVFPKAPFIKLRQNIKGIKNRIFKLNSNKKNIAISEAEREITRLLFLQYRSEKAAWIGAEIACNNNIPINRTNSVLGTRELYVRNI
jgi:hypothetical protein